MDKIDSDNWCRTRHLEGRIFETVYHGKLMPEMVDQVRRELEALLRQHGGGDWLIDTVGVTGLRPAPSVSTSGFFEAFRAAGGRRIAAVIVSGPVRMIASALSFAAAQDLRVFASREEALRYLRTPA
jgi:hypothetical protein